MSGPGLSLAEIAALCGVPVPSAADDATTIDRVGAAAGATARTLVFAEDEKALAAAVQSAAGVILASPATAGEAGQGRVLAVRQPRWSFAVCAQALAAQQRRPAEGDAAQIDPAAAVHPSAKLGARVRVSAGAVVEAGAELGEDTTIGANVVIAEGVVVGARVVVQAGAVLGSRGFGYVRNRETGEYLLFPQQGALVIEDDVEIGANTTIDRGALEETRIGRGTKIDNLVHIGHNCRIGRNVVIAAQAGISGSCVVEDGAVLAGQVGLSDHCHIGPGVILGGQAGVYRGKAVRGPGEVFSGTPAEPLREQMRGLARLRALAKPAQRKEE